jgi:hypothetical protein
MIPLHWQKHARDAKASLIYEANMQDDNAVRFVPIAP